MGNLFTRITTCLSKPNHSRDDNSTSSDLDSNFNNNSSSARKSTLQKQAYSWDVRHEDEQNDCLIRDQSNQTIIKEFNTIKNQAINVENLQNCLLIIKDGINGAIIDTCEDCVIFIACSNESVFIRESKNITLILITSQIRLRDIQNMSLVIKCDTTVAIEDTLNLRVSPFCFDFDYLPKILKTSGMLEIFNNIWYKIHNFSPGYNIPGSNVQSFGHQLIDNFLDQDGSSDTIEKLKTHGITVSNSTIPVVQGRPPEALPNAVSTVQFTVFSFLSFEKRALTAPEPNPTHPKGDRLASICRDLEIYRTWEGHFKNLYFEGDLKRSIVTYWSKRVEEAAKSQTKNSASPSKKPLDLDHIYLVCIESDQRIDHKYEKEFSDCVIFSGNHVDAHHFFSNREG